MIMSVDKEWDGALDYICLHYGRDITEDLSRLSNLLADLAPQSDDKRRSLFDTLNCMKIRKFVLQNSNVKVDHLAFRIREEMHYDENWSLFIASGIVKLFGERVVSCDEEQDIPSDAELKKARKELINDLAGTLSNSVNEKLSAINQSLAEIKYSEGLSIARDVTEGYFVYGKGDCKDIYIKIPPEYKGAPVRRIESYAFWNRNDIKGVTIPSSVNRIESGAFDDCHKLERIELPEGLEKIPNSIFWECHALKKADIPKSVKEIGLYAFYSCKSLESLVIPDGVKVIEDACFYGCTTLDRVTIPATVCEMKNNAFGHCQNLKRIDFGGTCRQWLNMKRAKDWKSISMSGKIYCTDGVIEF